MHGSLQGRRGPFRILCTGTRDYPSRGILMSLASLGMNLSFLACRRWLGTLACCVLTIAGSCEASSSLEGLLHPILFPASEVTAPLDDDPDDDMLNQETQRLDRDEVRLGSVTLSADDPGRQSATRPLTQAQFRSTPLACEHAYRNGVGVPLLC